MSALGAGPHGEPQRVALVNPDTGAAVAPAAAGGAKVLFAVTNTALGAGETVNSGTLDLRIDPDRDEKWKQITVSYFTSVASATNGWVLEASTDGTNWYNYQTATLAAVTVVTGGPNANFPFRYLRLRYTNGAAAGVFAVAIQGAN